MAKRSSEYYKRLAIRCGMEVKQGAKHIKISAVDQAGQKSSMMLPRDLKGDGTERTIVKWFAKMGVLIGILAAILAIAF